MTGGGPLDATTTLPILVYLKAFSISSSDVPLRWRSSPCILGVLLALYFVLSIARRPTCDVRDAVCPLRPRRPRRN